MKMILLFLSLLSGPTLLSGQSSVKIRVQDKHTREPLLMAQVTIYHNGTFYQSGATDFEGQFNVQLPTGKYLFEAHTPGYAMQHLIDVAVQGDETLELHFFLQELPVEHPSDPVYPHVAASPNTQSALGQLPAHRYPLAGSAAVSTTASGLASPRNENPFRQAPVKEIRDFVRYMPGISIDKK
ncbi:MAG: carboxypeptidase-like regulatory domain-containing protein [Bacteroidota bacterium]